MIITIIGILLSGVVSWFISRGYYKKSNAIAPEWAQPFIDKLPSIVPTDEELLRLFQNEINEGTITPHSVFQHVACPNCNAPLDDLKEKIMGDDYHTILKIECPHCGWSDWSEV